MYKVFINEKVIYFTNNSENYRQLYNCLIINFFNPNITPIILNLFTKCRKTKVVVVFVKDYELAFLQFQSYFEIINAAGGVVRNTKAEKLFIYRLDKWDLPKGKIEKGENEMAAAIREVKEECGEMDLIITRQLSDTYHIYKIGEKHVLKKTNWFEMKSDFEGEFIPQKEEDITKVEWLTDEQVKNKALSNTYASIKDLLGVNGYL